MTKRDMDEVETTLLHAFARAQEESLIITDKLNRLSEDQILASFAVREAQRKLKLFYAEKNKLSAEMIKKLKAEVTDR
jgi:hypothetical protein